jgi:CubicO group peptidase (beta-lactamase class C family)
VSRVNAETRVPQRHATRRAPAVALVVQMLVATCLLGPRAASSQAGAETARAAAARQATARAQSVGTVQVPKFVDSLFRDMRSPNGPGCVIAFDSAGRRRWLTSFGLRDLERGGRNDSTTVFEAGSVSKQFAAAAVVLLARSGKLSLDDDIRRWIPELPDLGGTTVRQVLTHQSGWRDWRNLVAMTRWPSGTAAYTLQDALAIFARQRALDFPSGTEYSYSNTNYALAAILVERVSGESLRAFTTRAIFAPLGMRQTLWRDSLSEIVPNRALPFSPTDAGRFRLDAVGETVIGPGGLLTTAPDLMKWLRNFDTQQVGGAGFSADMERVGVLRSGRETKYAMGLEVDALDGERMVFHAGWTGGYVAWAGRLPRRQLALGVLCNGSAINTEEIGPVLLSRLARLTPPEAVRPELGDTARTGLLASATGLYRSLRTLQPVTLRGFANGFSLNTWIGYARAADGSFVSMDGKRRASFLPDATSSPTGFVVRSSDGDSVAYERLDAALPTAAQLREYVGRYRNEDTLGEMELRLTDDKLVAWRGGVLSDRVIPLFRDGFRVPSQSWVLTMRRDASGRVAGFDLGLPRMRRLPFERLP